MTVDITPTLKLAPLLASDVLERKALIDGGAALTDYCVMAVDKRMAIRAADLKAACEGPQTFQPWSPANPGNTK